MHGVCYNGNLLSGNLDMEEKNFSSYDFTSAFWYNPLNGFSVHYPTQVSCFLSLFAFASSLFSFADIFFEIFEKMSSTRIFEFIGRDSVYT